MSAAILAFSARGMRLGETLRDYFTKAGRDAILTRCEEGGLQNWTRENFSKRDALVFIGSCGIAVRAIAPFVADKCTDPAVIVLDECGAFSVSLLSGHLGGGNALANELATAVGATAVITTATDRNGVFAVDEWARKTGLTIANPEQIKRISARLLAGDVLRLRSLFPLEGDLPHGLTLADAGCGDILITCKMGDPGEALRLIPPVITLGIGARRGVPADAIEQAFLRMLEQNGCHPAAVRQVCSVDLKQNEPGILRFCERRCLPFVTYSADRLNAVEGAFSASPFVRQVTGSDNICERSAVLGSGSGGRLIAKKTAENGITMALAQSAYTVRFKHEGI